MHLSYRQQTTQPRGSRTARRRRVAALCLVPPLAAWPVVPALGQTAPNAGSILQQIERGIEPRLPSRAEPPRVTPAPEEITAPGAMAIDVKQFRFTGNTLLSAAVLSEVVAPWRGRTVDFNELRKATAAVAEAYRQAGWIVRAYLPRQDITEGVVTIHIIEAVFGAARAEGEPGLRLKLDRALSYINAAQKPGEPVSAAALDRALLLIEDLPGVGAAGSLMPGARDGETDLALKLVAEPLFNGEVGIDGAGTRSTGSVRATATLLANSPLGFGEQASANLIASEGSEYLRLGATLPVGAHGWRVGVNGSALRYRLVSPEFAALNARGTSQTSGLEASYPLLRARLSNVYVNLNVDHRHFDNQSSGAVVTRYSVNSASASVQGNHFDSWGGGGANLGSVTFVTGRVNLNGSPNQAADAAGSGVDGAFSKVRYAASRRQVLTETFSAVAALSGQWSANNLDSSEKFYLGGPNGVRAYPVNEGGGASGQLLNLEARAALPHNVTLTSFYDWGRVVVNSHKDFAGAAVINQMTLKGAGLSAGWTGAGGAHARLTWARRIGNNPNPTAAGLDQDGSKTLNRLWLVAGFSF